MKPETADFSEAMAADSDLHRCTELWFEDGTVVLQAEKSLFRVYRGILAANVEVFKDMFSVARPDMTESFEGSPLVRLPDAAKDMEHFLKALLDPGYYDRICSVDFAAVIGILRLSSKYECSHFRRRIVSQLKQVYPHSLKAWEERYEPAKTIFPSIGAARAFMALQAASELDIPSLLPATLVICASFTPQTILEGARVRDSAPYELDWTNKKLCIVAQNKLLSASKKSYSEALLECDPERCH